MPTPLYDCLKEYAAAHPLRMHMPGHKGRELPVPELAGLAALDVTELSPTGNLFEGGAPFDDAQSLWARRFGFDHCQFLTGGSTMGVHTALTLCSRPGEEILVDRGCHRSVFHSMALLDLKPTYLPRPWLEGDGITGPFSPDDVEKALSANPNIKTVCITSPTYCGVLSDIRGISQIVHAYGGKLVVDGAHGAHLPFLGIDPFEGADAVVVSAHKTLPAMGQSALLFTRGMEPALVAKRATLYGSSSPSYPMMACLDVVRDYMEGEGKDGYQRAAAEVARLREKFPCLKPPLPLDPCRLSVKCKDGPALTARLEEMGIYPEMDDMGHVVFIITCADREEELLRLEQGLAQWAHLLGDCPISIPAPPLPEGVLTQRQALFAPTRTLALEDCEGEICACQLAPYPPGVPVVAPGERISKKLLSYFKQIGYNNDSVDVVISSQQMG